MDLTTLTDAELDALANDIRAERHRRKIPEHMNQLNRDYLAATGHTDGEEWTQPTGAHDAYPQGFTVTHNGTTWESLIPANVWEPGVSGWREVTEGDEPAEWVQPTGTHDAYNTGDLVTYEGTVYRSTIDNNTWAPTDYPAGWEQV